MLDSGSTTRSDRSAHDPTSPVTPPQLHVRGPASVERLQHSLSGASITQSTLDNLSVPASASKIWRAAERSPIKLSSASCLLSCSRARWRRQPRSCSDLASPRWQHHDRFSIVRALLIYFCAHQTSKNHQLCVSRRSRRSSTREVWNGEE